MSNKKRSNKADKLNLIAAIINLIAIIINLIVAIRNG